MTALGADRRAALVAAKAAALVAAHTGTDVGTPHLLPGGAGLMVGDCAWVLLDDRPELGLGRALAWAGRHHATHVAVMAEQGTGVLARRASCFATPIEVFSVTGRDLDAASPESAGPEIQPSPGELDAAADLVALGADVVVEHGVVTAEIRGLEMARVVTTDGVAVVQPGVGRNDRDGHAMVLAGADAGAHAATLARVAADLAAVRAGEAADRHPLGRMARERWLRRMVIDNPARVGARALGVAEPTVARTSVSDPGAAFAVGHRDDGHAVAVACSVGIDLDLVPAAADVALVHAQRTGTAEVDVVLVMARRDDMAVTRRLASSLVRPATIVTIDDDWYHHDTLR
jgi:hypothetical protein